MTDDFKKHSVSTDALETLGSIIGPAEKRDAIHLAVFPVSAGETLKPGQHVEVAEDGLAYSTLIGLGVGIVDPFLEKPVQTDERFWLVVYPRQISSLRHVWEHPSFPPSGETEHLLIDMGPNKYEAELWLRDYADHATVDFHGLMVGATRAAEEGLDYIYMGEDASGEIPREFWDYFKAYTGIEVRGTLEKYFSCAC